MSIGRRHHLALLALLLAGLAVRLCGAWLCRRDTSTDRGRAGLMALHMAQGRDYPVFFYGGAYLGTVEPAASALMMRLFGVNGFTLNLGTAALGFLILPLVYRWAREMSGPKAGLAAAALLLVGPFDYFYFLASPRGGYAATLLFGSAVLWLAGRLAHKTTQNEGSVRWESIGLGAAAGLAWWSHQLSIAALTAAALVILFVARRNLARVSYWTAIPTFFLASAPWWIWNATHHWATLRLAGSFGTGMPIVLGVRLFFGELSWNLLDLPSVPTPAAVTVALLMLGAAAFGLAWAARQIRRKTVDPFACHLAVTLSFFLVSAVFFAGSHYAMNRSTRYLLPLLPPLAVTLAALGARWRLTARPAVALPVVAAVVAWQIVAARNAFLADKDKDAAWNDAPKLAQFCREHGVEALYGNIWQHWINFASREQCLVCDLMSEPYAPYASAAERATRCGLLGNYENLSAFLHASGGAGQIAMQGAFAIQYDFVPPPAAAPVPAKSIARISNERGEDLSFVADGVVSEGRDWIADQTCQPMIRFALSEPTEVCGIRLRCREHYYPWRMAVEGRTAESEDWRMLLPETPGTLFFWSGPRWYWFGLFFRQEYRWAPARVSELRVRLCAAEKPYLTALEEITLLAPGTHSVPPTPSSVESLLRALTTRGFQKVYADRWLSAQLAAVSNRVFYVPQPSFTRRDIYSLLEPTRAEYVTVENIGPDTAFVAECEEAESCAAALEGLGLTVNRETVEPWVILWADANGTCDPAVRAYPGFEWSGQTLLKLPPSRYMKRRAAWRLRNASELPPSAEREEQERRALAEYPGFAPVVAAAPLADSSRDSLVRFARGVELRSLQVTPARASAGKCVEVRYRWICPSNTPLENRIVFVHFQNGEFRFQDDHRLMEGIPSDHIVFQPFPRETFEIARSVAIPPNAPRGNYQVIVGLHDAVTGQRERPRTRLPVRQRAVVMPCVLAVE